MNAVQNLGVVLTPYAWATHVLLGAAMQSLVAGCLTIARVSRAWWYGAALAIGYAWSREKTEFEFMLKAAARANSLGAFWYRGFVPLEWDRASQLQFYTPALAVVLIALLHDRWSRRRFT